MVSLLAAARCACASVLRTNGGTQSVSKIVSVDAVIALTVHVLHAGPTEASLAGNLDPEHVT
jgi:hypothetical protein